MEIKIIFIKLKVFRRPNPSLKQSSQTYLMIHVDGSITLRIMVDRQINANLPSSNQHSERIPFGY